jgi:hypothetical protein
MEDIQRAKDITLADVADKFQTKSDLYRFAKGYLYLPKENNASITIE